jgi:hypothetical protein
MRYGNKFIDPATGVTFVWPVNHLTEDGGGGSSSQAGLTRNITYSAPISLGTLIRQQAAPDPLTLSWVGTALTRAQHQEFLYWYALSGEHTIYLEDFAGDVFEVQITAYDPKRRAVAINPRTASQDPTVGNPLWVYDFTITMDVIKAISGDWVVATP